MTTRRRFELDQPESLLRFLSTDPAELSLQEVDVAEIFSLAGLAALGRVERQQPLRIRFGSDPTSGFALAVGLEDVLFGRPAVSRGEAGRTVKLTRIRDFSRMDGTAREISELLAPGDLQDTRETIQYVLIELWRNVVQHSADPLGGVVAAQRNDRGRNLNEPVIQVAVADAGIGIQAHLSRAHPSLKDSQAAIQKALEPHISGAFEEGQTGSADNAGMGLFFVSEMTKLVGGRMLIASRGAAFSLRGDPDFQNRHDIRAFARGIEFPGTLVAFEMPAGEQQDFPSMIKTILERAKERTPQRQINRWLLFETAPAGTQRFVVRIAGEDTEKAKALAQKSLVPRISEGRPVALDFSGIRVATQSFVHALLFQPIRVAWALKVPVYVENVEAPVRTTLELLQNYALSG